MAACSTLSSRLVDELPRLRHRHRADFRDGFARKANGARLRAKARAVAFGTNRVTSIAAQENPDVEFVFLPFEPLEEAVHPVISGFGIAFDHHVALRGRKIAEGNIERDIVRAGKFLHLDQQRAVARLRPRLNRAFVERLAAVGNHQIDIEIDGIAEALAARAGPVGIVERKQARFGLLIHGAARLALESLVEDHAFRGSARRLGHKFEDRFPASFAIADLDRIDQPRAHFGTDREAVHDHVNRLREIDIEQRFRRREFMDAARLIKPLETAPLQRRRAPAGWPREKPWPAFLPRPGGWPPVEARRIRACTST